MLSGAILSGGMSTRMGEEKGLAVLGGKPLVSYVARTLESVADEIVIAVARGMSRRYREVLGDEYTIAEDDRAGVGPLQGLVTALSAAEKNTVIVSPCDTPFLKVDLCESIVSLARKRDGAVPRVRGNFEPLHGVYARIKCLAAFEEAIAEGRQRPVDAYRMLNLEYIDEEIVRVTDPRLESFWNLNSREDLELAEERLHRNSNY
jgi:molybdopterin-guanine dinucleotide biosynthesis protein A